MDMPPNRKGVAGDMTGSRARMLIRELECAYTQEEIGNRISRSASVVGAIKSGEIANPPLQVITRLERAIRNMPDK